MIFSKAINIEKQIGFIVAALLFLLPFGLFSQTVTIAGSSDNAAGQELGIRFYSDLISMEQKELLRTRIAADGSFKTSFTIRETGAYLIDVAGYQASIYLQPGKKYRIHIDSLNVSNPLLYFSLSNNRMLSYYFLEEEGDINRKMAGFYETFDGYIARKFSHSSNRRNIELYDSLVLMLKSEFSADTSQFFRSLIGYNLAYLEYSLHLSQDVRIFETWVKDKPVLLRHPVYMSFFTEFFDRFLIARGRAFSYSELQIAIREQKSYSALCNLLARDSVLRNTFLCEVVLMQNISYLYNHRDFQKADITEILRQAAVQSRYPEIRLIASNLLTKLGRFEPGAAAPAFSLLNHKGDSIHLEDYRGKYVLLCFLNSRQLTSLQDAELMMPWPVKYRRSLQLISVHVDEYPIQTNDFIKKYKPGWQVCQSSIFASILQDYKVPALPWYVLIDPAGFIISYPAKRPGDNFEGFFRQLIGAR